MRTPREDFDIAVKPACEQYFRDSTSEWKAKAAAQAINNFAEWTFRYCMKYDPAKLQGTTKPADFRKMHARACPEFQVVWDVADAAKHRTLDSYPAMRVVTTSTGGWAETADTLEIKKTGAAFDEVVGVAMEYWEKQI